MRGADLELVQVTKKYGGSVAVDSIDLRIPGDAYCCLLGPFGLRKNLDAADDCRSRKP